MRLPRILKQITLPFVASLEDLYHKILEEQIFHNRWSGKLIVFTSAHDGYCKRQMEIYMGLAKKISLEIYEARIANADNLEAVRCLGIKIIPSTIILNPQPSLFPGLLVESQILGLIKAQRRLCLYCKSLSIKEDNAETGYCKKYKGKMGIYDVCSQWKGTSYQKDI